MFHFCAKNENFIKSVMFHNYLYSMKTGSSDVILIALMYSIFLKVILNNLGGGLGIVFFPHAVHLLFWT